MSLLRRVLILSHRYAGLVLGLLVVMWFATGIVMMYAGGMPRLTPQMRLARLDDLDLSRVRLTPEEAARAVGAGGGDWAPSVELLTVMERPAYRVGGVTVFADTGELMDEVSTREARRIASRFVGAQEDRIHHVGTLTRVDQWTIEQSQALPLYRFRVDDPSATELYVSRNTGEVTTLTTRGRRALAWIGTIPHWFYFAALRENQPLWYDLVVWSSGAVCALALLGLALGVVQFRRTRPFRLSRAIPYSGWMRWHYVSGAVFGVFTLTWAFSGMLSMEPFAWTNATGLSVPRATFTGGPVDLAAFGAMEPSAWHDLLGGRPVREVGFARIQDEPYYVVRLAPEAQGEAAKRERLHQPYYITGRAERDRVLVHAGTLEPRLEPFSEASLLARLGTALPDAHVRAADLLTEYDAYYYSRARQTPLPVLRVKFDDPAETWVYVDPEMSQVLGTVHRLNRVERWLYNGLHSLDFAFWYDRRPLWDVGVLALLLGGLASSGLGLVMAVKRLRRGVVRTTARAGRPGGPAPAPVSETVAR